MLRPFMVTDAPTLNHTKLSIADHRVDTIIQAKQAGRASFHYRARATALGYGAAILASVAAYALMLALSVVVKGISPFVIFLPAVAAVAWYGGFRPGVVTAFLNAVGSFYRFAPQNRLYELPRPVHLVEIVLFAAAGIFISYVIDLVGRYDVIAEHKRREYEDTQLLLKVQEEYARAQREIKARDEFLSIASHELKTPLSSMLLQLQTVLHNVRNVSLANFSVQHLLKMLESAEQQSQRLSKMINDLLNVSLITTGRLELELESADLSQIVQDVAQRFSEKMERDGYVLNLKASEEITGLWDKLRMEQLVTNLISNAIKYGGGKPIEVSLVRHHDTAVLTVRDHGIGIPEEQQERIFARFERAVKSHDYEGLGVGLYITHQIVTAHGGTIAVKSRPQAGSTFTVKLPITTA